MAWLFYALGGALCTATSQTFIKIAASRGASLSLCRLALTGGPALLVFWLLAVNGWEWCLTNGLADPSFWRLQLLLFALTSVALIFSMRTLKLGDATFLAATTGINAVAISLPPIFILNEIPTRGTWLGLAIVAVATFILAGASGKGARRADNRRALMFFALTLPFYCCCPAVLRLCLNHGDPALVFGISQLLITCLYLFMQLCRRCRLQAAAETIWPLLLVGISSIASGLLTNQALLLTTVANAMTAKKLAPVFFFIAGIVVFHEREQLSRRGLALALMVIGVLCMAFII